MPRPIKTSADFKNEISTLVESLGNGGEQRVRNAFRKYKTIEKKNNCGQKPLTEEEIKLLNDSSLRNIYLIGRQLDYLEKKRRAAENKEKKTNTPAAAIAISNRAMSVSIIKRVEDIAVEDGQTATGGVEGIVTAAEGNVKAKGGMIAEDNVTLKDLADIMEEDVQHNTVRGNDEGMVFDATAKSAPVGRGMSLSSTQRVRSKKMMMTVSEISWTDCQLVIQFANCQVLIVYHPR